MNGGRGNKNGRPDIHSTVACRSFEPHPSDYRDFHTSIFVIAINIWVAALSDPVYKNIYRDNKIMLYIAKNLEQHRSKHARFPPSATR
jgi:hypothetical protein